MSRMRVVLCWSFGPHMDMDGVRWYVHFQLRQRVQYPKARLHWIAPHEMLNLQAGRSKSWWRLSPFEATPTGEYKQTKKLLFLRFHNLVNLLQTLPGRDKEVMQKAFGFHANAACS
ncbi:hypothetical protein BRADI_3g44376v3 [Brachypodium distachyon]|uniref:Uncharacterized protein n=1 Tax=Brachypodium distachyon TaxID=15368 RepID=A0A2K2D353_BRADI|nr:hypothetical protein BRADI_3g44376v3 [Brachypodium distachyon]